MSNLPIFTYQARIAAGEGASSALDAYAALYGKVERSLFAAMQKSGANLNALKREFLSRFGITARQFNAVRIGLEGKIDSIKARRPDLIQELQARIKAADKVIAKLRLRPTQAAKLHQKKRRHAILLSKLAAMQADHKDGLVRLCFGSKRLFRAQFALSTNGYANHQEWKDAWQSARSDQFFVLGSGDETAGNQSCQASSDGDGSLSLMLRLPGAMLRDGDSKYLTLIGVRFAYGHQSIVDALSQSQRIQSVTKAGKAIAKRIGCALSYRFVRDAKGWRVFVSCEAQDVPLVSSRMAGAIGVDMNADHLAVSEVDRFGNWIHSQRIALPTYGKTSHQAKALIGDAAVAIADQARIAGKPVVIEKLDFAKKKAGLESTHPRYARMLSSFVCNKVSSSIKAACFRLGVECFEVNPAYTSVIGAVNFAQVKGISVHMGAATAIARRGLGLSEQVPKRVAVVPARSGGHVTFCVPVRNRQKHVWTQWAKVRTSLKAAHVAHFRSGTPKGMPAPLSSVMQALGSIRSSTAQFRGANRQQHCSVDVLMDVPF